MSAAEQVEAVGFVVVEIGATVVQGIGGALAAYLR